MRKILFSEPQVDAAAKFIFENNSRFVKSQKKNSWQDVKNDILNHMKSVVKRDSKAGWSSTGGWSITFCDSENGVECEVFVDAAISEEDFSWTEMDA